jgi:hypothetical protein
MLEDSNPENTPDFSNRIANVEFEMFWRDLQQLPSMLPHEKILVGVERFLSDGNPKKLITDIPEEHQEALVHLRLAVEQHICDLCDNEIDKAEILLLHQQDYLVPHEEDPEIAVTFRLRRSDAPVEYLMTHEALFSFDGHSSLITATADFDDPESFCLDAHFDKSGLAAMQTVFARCLSLGDDNSEVWRETYIGHMLLENFPTPVTEYQDPLLRAAKAVDSIKLIKHQHSKLHLALQTHSQGEVQAIVQMAPSHRKLTIEFAKPDP